MSNADLDLVYAGPCEDRRLADQVRGLGGRVLGEVTEAGLEWLYRHAAFSVAPSTVEGFGLPVSESLARSCVTVASDIAPFAEIGGQHPGCVLFRPGDVDDLARAMEQAANLGPVSWPRGGHTWADCVDDLLASLVEAATCTERARRAR
jgi:glycosyltransferase involved in cell wall biosynthesis